MCRLTDESMRWLEMRGRHDEVIGVLEKIATMNKKPLADLPRAPPLKVILFSLNIYCNIV
jgi:hypothetical protein